MIYVRIGDDSYGAVRRVGPSRVATEFRMVGGLPIWPLESLYLGRWRKTHVMIPLEAGDDVPESALPLAHIDRPSVWLTYVRAAACLPILFGAIGIIFGVVMLLTGDRPDIPPEVIAGVGAALVGAGVLAAVATYLAAPRASPRERAIRLACDEVFGLAADPAAITLEYATDWAGKLELKLHAFGIDDFVRAAEAPDRLTREHCRLVLMRVRAQIALSWADGDWERLTDRMLRMLPEGRDVMELA